MYFFEEGKMRYIEFILKHIKHKPILGHKVPGGETCICECLPSLNIVIQAWPDPLGLSHFRECE